MKPFFRCWWIVIAFAAAAQTALAAKPGEPGGPGEYRDFKVLKTYSAKAGPHIFRAYVIEWEGQEVIARDVGVRLGARTDDTINVLVSRAVPRAGESSGRILFLARPERKAPLERSQIRETPPEDIAANPPIEAKVRVHKVYALAGGDYAFRAYEVEWQGQPVIVHDLTASTTLGVGDTAIVRVMQVPSPDRNKSYGLLDFVLVTERSADQRQRR